MILRTILAIEGVSLLREKVVPVLLGVSSLLAVFAVFSGGAWLNFRQAAVNEVAEFREDRAARYVADAHRFADGLLDPDVYASPVEPYWVYAFFPLGAEAPPDPLSLISVGKSDLLPYYRLFSGMRENDLLHEAEIQNPLSQELGRFDLAFFVTVVLPLLIIALSFNLLPREAESGRLLLARAQGVDVGRWTLTRLAVRAGAFLVPLVLVAAVALVVFSPEVVGPDVLPRFLAFLGLTLAYAIFWIGLSFLVTTRATSSLASAAVLVALWGAQVLFLPAAVNAVSEARNPVPSGLLRPLQEREVRLGIESEDLLDAYLAANPDLVPVAARTDPEAMEVFQRRMGVPWIPASETTRHALRAQEREVRQIIVERERTASSLAMVSPALVLQLAFARLGRTRAEDSFQFLEAQEGYADRWRDEHRRAVFYGAAVSPAALEQIGPFTLPPSSDPELPRAGIEMLGMLLLAILAMLAGLRFTRTRENEL